MIRAGVAVSAAEPKPGALIVRIGKPKFVRSRLSVEARIARRRQDFERQGALNAFVR